MVRSIHYIGAAMKNERVIWLQRFGLHNFPADTTPGECADIFNRWLCLHSETYPNITAAALGRLLPELGFQRIGRASNGRQRLFNPHYRKEII